MAVNGYDPVMGYLELGMADEALSELDAMSLVKKKTERHAELLLAAQMMLKDWHAAVNTAERLCSMNGKKCGYFIHAAFCLHEVGNTKGAMRRLLTGPKALLMEPLYHYNIACYHATLGQVESAKQALAKAFELDGKLREVAKEDEDLRGIDL